VGSLSKLSSEEAILLARFPFEESFSAALASGLTSLLGAGDVSGATAGVAVESEL